MILTVGVEICWDLNAFFLWIYHFHENGQSNLFINVQLVTGEYFMKVKKKKKTITVF